MGQAQQDALDTHEHAWSSFGYITDDDYADRAVSRICWACGTREPAIGRVLLKRNGSEEVLSSGWYGATECDELAVPDSVRPGELLSLRFFPLEDASWATAARSRPRGTVSKRATLPVRRRVRYPPGYGDPDRPVRPVVERCECAAGGAAAAPDGVRDLRGCCRPRLPHVRLHRLRGSIRRVGRQAVVAAPYKPTAAGVSAITSGE